MSADDPGSCPPSSSAAAALGLGGIALAIVGAVGWYGERARANQADEQLRRAGLAPQGDHIDQAVREAWAR